ncbi:MAG: DnaJ domain-containing protein [Planctomycetota bacterium]
MADRSTLQYWVRRFALGIAMLLAGGLGLLPRVLHIKDPTGLSSLLLGGIGFYVAYTAVGPITRLLGYQARTRKTWSDAASNTFARASLPRRLFYLLVAVAESDGPMSQSEREVVRHFLLERFMDPVDANEIRTWEMQPLAIEDRIGLAARIAAGLDEPELDTIFCWCTLVTFADGKFRTDEHAALQDVARGLGITAPRARMLFHLARAQHLKGQARGTGGGESDGGRRSQDARSRAQRPANARIDALAVLGLPVHASLEQIRRRHRELVRKFHPDAQPNLGPVAQKEASERFQSIQRAYESLTATA